MADRVGQQLGNYRLVALLGQGSYAQVYLGQHVRLPLQVAIKVLHSHLTGREAHHFQQEAETIARLAHPSIVRILDYDVQAGVPFLVMDYAPNGSLRRRYPKGTVIPLPQIVSYVKQIAAGLHYAHDQKVIHRDVKPENILVGRHEEMLLSDFGLAALAHSSASLSTQEAMGTLAYMAPEQIEGYPRAASDQYALGVMVYEWLCGSRPFEGSFSEVMGQHLSIPPPPLRERVQTILRRPEVRLVTLTGTGGIGKTRLAVQLATGLLADFEGGVYFVSLAPISDPELVMPTIAQTLDVKESGTQPDFQLTKANAIAAICTRLDGLPLAIELAAADIKLLPPAALLARLEHRLAVLTGGAQNLPARQQTLRNTLEWSYQLLDTAEQRLFRRLSVFAGGCTLEAIESIFAAFGDEAEPVLDGVTSLLDKSLLQQTDYEGEEPRLMMLETIREYGLECLRERAEAEASQRAHALYYLALAEEAEPQLKGAQQVRWWRRLEREQDNLRAALSWFIECEETELALRLSGALWRF
jgi:serine/threonine protein kinase